MTRPLDAAPRHQPRARRVLGEVLAPFDGLRLLPALPRQLLARDAPQREVLVLPGWLAGDRSTLLLRAVLARDGHRVRGWGLGRNTGDVPSRIAAVATLVADRARATGTSLDLIGWSLGGVIAREVARRDPDAVRRVTTMGTPLHGPAFTAFAALFVDELDEAARERVERTRAAPPPVPVTVIWSRRDGIVHWRAQQDRDNPWADHVEVPSTHLGMGLDPTVLDTVRDRAAAEVTTAVRG